MQSESLVDIKRALLPSSWQKFQAFSRLLRRYILMLNTFVSLRICWKYLQNIICKQFAFHVDKILRNSFPQTHHYLISNYHHLLSYSYHKIFSGCKNLMSFILSSDIHFTDEYLGLTDYHWIQHNYHNLPMILWQKDTDLTLLELTGSR